MLRCTLCAIAVSCLYGNIIASVFTVYITSIFYAICQEDKNIQKYENRLNNNIAIII